MTPAVDLLNKHKMKFKIHQYQHDKNCDAYGLEAAQKMGIDGQLVFKTLVVNVDNENLLVCILPVTKMLNLKKVAKVCTAKKVVLADKQAVLRSTGYVLGGVSPLGQKKRLKTVLDNSALALQCLYVSAGKRGLEIALNPTDLINLTNALNADICQ
ncbi:ybaK/ebsC protein [Psychromonas ingrahamii 37]|uniref:Cys-tRNA(Pro)/Cys-tRNA(Cys) deacylase n=1 Tax=Psychromonas ingrahamii (strain DSM 17664 / CCUG 51855 / 37) TaxID=357804 RepID=A1SUW3_PSYIN|nr:Cys-tRNA(Pro) deacylase [Psychromonas ingrahamii]ABM03278.1 ybaK/ebsC protein [Psychromonas ingrahamii 37]